jgi:periodic tryptophan protein 1
VGSASPRVLLCESTSKKVDIDFSLTIL